MLKRKHICCPTPRLQERHSRMIKIFIKADWKQNKNFSVTENQHITEYHDYRRENVLAEVGTDDEVENVSTNYIMSTLKHSLKKK